jgi:hypothetical protein
MEDIDQTIDMMNKEQLVTCVAKSYAQRRKLNVKYTTQNQRVSIDRIEKIYENFERLIRDILKVWIRDEKIVRLKYLKPMTEKRRTLITSELFCEMDVVLRQINDECRLNYKKMGELELFEERIKVTENRFKADIENKIGELFEKINCELEGSKKKEPEAFVKMYGIHEQTLIELRLITPLQEINVTLDEAPADFKPVTDGIQNTLKLCGKYYDKGGLKNVVVTIHTLLGFYLLPEEIRNHDVIEKNKIRLVGLLKLAPEADERLKQIQPFLDWF